VSQQCAVFVLCHANLHTTGIREANTQCRLLQRHANRDR
jgi:hypothetical protein